MASEIEKQREAVENFIADRARETVLARIEELQAMVPEICEDCLRASTVFDCGSDDCPAAPLHARIAELRKEIG